MATPPLCLGRTSQQWECVTEDADHSMATRKQRTRQEGVVDTMSRSVKKKKKKERNCYSPFTVWGPLKSLSGSLLCN